MTTFLEEFCQDFIQQYNPGIELSCFGCLYIYWNGWSVCNLVNRKLSPSFKWTIRPLNIYMAIRNGIWDGDEYLREALESIIRHQYYDVRDENTSDQIMFLFEMFPEAFIGY